MRFPLLLIILATLLSGCATTNNLQRVDSITKSEPILVLSQFNEALKIKSIGTTIFTNGEFDINAKSWRINDYAEGIVKKLLDYNYTVITNPELRNKVSQPEKNYISSKIYSLNLEPLQPFIKEKGIKYLIVINPLKAGDRYFGTDEFFEGFGIGQRGAFGFEFKKIFLQMNFMIFDASNGAFIADGLIGSPDDEAPPWIISKDKTFAWLNEAKDVDKKLLTEFEIEMKEFFKVLLKRNVRELRFKTIL